MSFHDKDTFKIIQNTPISGLMITLPQTKSPSLIQKGMKRVVRSHAQHLANHVLNELDMDLFVSHLLEELQAF